MKFVACRSFFSETLRSGYEEGLTYTVRPQPIFEHRDGQAVKVGETPADKTLLAAEVKKWLAEAPPLVRLLSDGESASRTAAAGGRIQGRGTVTSPLVADGENPDQRGAQVAQKKKK